MLLIGENGCETHLIVVVWHHLVLLHLAVAHLIHRWILLVLCVLLHHHGLLEAFGKWVLAAEHSSSGATSELEASTSISIGHVLALER